MPVWELVAFSTEDRGETAVRYRRYTISERRARLFGQIPRIDFTDNGHGIVFDARPHTGKRKSAKGYTGSGIETYIEDHIRFLHDPRLAALLAVRTGAVVRDGGWWIPNEIFEKVRVALEGE